MDTIDKITRVLENNGYKNSQIDFHYDKEKNIYGYVTSEKINTKNRKNSLKSIWELLGKYLAADEVIRILAIFVETPEEKVKRLANEDIELKNNLSRFWVHKTYDSALYWIFVDTLKIEDGYKTFFLIINEKYSFHKGLIFNYPSKVIKFMMLKHGEVAQELHSNALDKAIGEIKIDLMNRYEELKKSEGLFGEDNRYHYVFMNFTISPVALPYVEFTPGEIKLLQKASRYYSKYSIGKEINEAIERSNTIISEKHEITL